MELLADRIRELRKRCRLSQPALAFEMNWSKSRISNYEQSYRTPTHEDLLKLGDLFSEYLGDVRLYLFTGRETVAPLDQKQSPSQLSKKEIQAQLEAFLFQREKLREIRINPKTSVEELAHSFSDFIK